MPDEVPTHNLLQHFMGTKRWLLPIVVGNEMSVREFQNFEQLRQGTYGIWEPQGEEFTAISEIDLVLVPGVAFDRLGHRCGHGKGYYDKWLSQPAASRIRTIGLAFDFQEFDQIPTDSHDVCLDQIIFV